MEGLPSIGRTLYAIAMLGFGALHLGYGDFVTRVVPWWPAALPGRPLWAYALGVLLVVAGGGHPTNAYWLPGCCPHVIGREIRVPESFETLLAEAAVELDPAA